MLKNPRPATSPFRTRVFFRILLDGFTASRCHVGDVARLGSRGESEERLSGIPAGVLWFSFWERALHVLLGKPIIEGFSKGAVLLGAFKSELFPRLWMRKFTAKAPQFDSLLATDTHHSISEVSQNQVSGRESGKNHDPA
eukprot:scaffold447_cov307-Pinguiococcus_pyrenoidosus.AAC.68